MRSPFGADASSEKTHDSSINVPTARGLDEPVDSVSRDTHSQVSQCQSEESRPINDDEPIPSSPQPDGGWMAWLQVISSFLIFFNVLGLINTYGQFQTIYETNILSTQSASTIAWIGSVQFLLCYTFCIFTGRLWDEGRLYVLLVTGTVIMVFGLIMLSLCREFYQFFLSQAVVLGFGFGFVFMPASGIVPQWFSTRAPFAIGVATTGSSFGKFFCLDLDVMR